MGHTVESWPFRPADKDLFFSRHDSQDPRLGDRVRVIDQTQLKKAAPTPLATVVAGYADEEGIQLNGGRLGARQGPDEIRKHLYKMTPDLLRSEHLHELYDVGNLVQDALTLERRHHWAQSAATTALSHGYRWLALGGGHDYGFADGAAFLSAMKDSPMRPIVINFDAHLDVRPLDRGFTSGTPFFRLLTEFQDFDFFEIGIQSQCNSLAHLEWAQSRGARVLTWPELESSGEPQTVSILRFLEPYLVKRRPAYVSIDIDGFSSSVAMGCSQSFATGFEPQEFLPVFEILAARLDIRVLGIYEVSPPLDLTSATGRLAALLAHRFLHTGGSGR